MRFSHRNLLFAFLNLRVLESASHFDSINNQQSFLHPLRYGSSFPSQQHDSQLWHFDDEKCLLFTCKAFAFGGDWVMIGGGAVMDQWSRLPFSQLTLVKFWEIFLYFKTHCFD
jgi:hypothetical protein